MKQRLISVAFGMMLLAVVLLLFDTVAVNIAFLLIGGLAIFETVRAFGQKENKWLLLSLWLPFAAVMFYERLTLFFGLFAMLFALFCFAMFGRRYPLCYTDAAGIFMAAAMITLGLAAILNMRGSVPLVADARFMFYIALGTGWLCDTFAYTFGRLFGKRKLCPAISPNKTVAGAVGGVLGTPVAITASFLIYAATGPAGSAFSGLNRPAHIAYYFAMGMVGAAVGIIGDLAASFIKRHCGIKDFGKIMPGHGGAFDRIDSILFTSVFVDFCFEIFFRLFVAF